MPLLYDKLELNKNIVLDLAMFEGAGIAGAVVHDLGRHHHDLVLTGTPIWTQLPSRYSALEYGGDASGDFLQCPAALSTELNITSEDFTILTWVYSDPAATNADMIICQNQVDVCGWEFYVWLDPADMTIALRTNQGGSHTGISAIGAFLQGQWTLVGVDRQGAWGQFYVNGLPVVTTLNGGLLDPVSAAGTRKLLVGIQWNEVANTWEGMIARVRVWKNRMLDVAAHLSVWENERAFYGV